MHFRATVQGSERIRLPEVRGSERIRLLEVSGQGDSDYWSVVREIQITGGQGESDYWRSGRIRLLEVSGQGDSDYWRSVVREVQTRTDLAHELSAASAGGDELVLKIAVNTQMSRHSIRRR